MEERKHERTISRRQRRAARGKKNDRRNNYEPLQNDARRLTMGRNFPGNSIYSYRFRLDDINVTSTAGGLIDTTVNINRSLVNSTSSTMLNTFQKYRFWKAEFHIYGCSVSQGVASFFTYDYDLAGPPTIVTQMKIIPTNTASPLSRATLVWKSSDYPDLDFIDTGATQNLCKFKATSFASSTFPNNQISYVVEVWGHFECKLFDS